MDHVISVACYNRTLLQKNYLRNKFNFWNVHGNMNTSGLLQETQSIHDSMNIQKIEFITYITFYYKYLIYRNY